MSDEVIPGDVQKEAPKQPRARRRTRVRLDIFPERGGARIATRLDNQKKLWMMGKDLLVQESPEKCWARGCGQSTKMTMSIQFFWFKASALLKMIGVTHQPLDHPLDRLEQRTLLRVEEDSFFWGRIKLSVTLWGNGTLRPARGQSRCSFSKIWALDREATCGLLAAQEAGVRAKVFTRPFERRAAERGRHGSGE